MPEPARAQARAKAGHPAQSGLEVSNRHTILQAIEATMRISGDSLDLNTEPPETD